MCSRSLSISCRLKDTLTRLGQIAALRHGSLKQSKVAGLGTVGIRRHQMIAALDVNYRMDTAIAAAVIFDDWHSTEPANELVRTFDSPAPYIPGRFFERELAFLLKLLEEL